MSDNMENRVREAFSSALEPVRVSVPTLDVSRASFRRRIRMALLAAGMAVVTALAIFLSLQIATRDDDRGDLRPVVPTEKTGYVGQWVTDGSARFRVGLVQCDESFSRPSEGFSGTPYCIVYMTVANDADEPLNLSHQWQSLGLADGQVYDPSNDSPEFRDYEENFISAHQAFREAVEPGSELEGHLFFLDLPQGERPAFVVLHSSADSEGVTIIIRDCNFESPSVCGSGVDQGGLWRTLNLVRGPSLLLLATVATRTSRLRS